MILKMHIILVYGIQSCKRTWGIVCIITTHVLQKKNNYAYHSWFLLWFAIRLNNRKGAATLIFLFANPCTAIALSYYDLAYMPHAIYHFKAYNIIHTNIITDDLLNV